MPGIRLAPDAENQIYLRMILRTSIHLVLVRFDIFWHGAGKTCGLTFAATDPIS